MSLDLDLVKEYAENESRMKILESRNKEIKAEVLETVINSGLEKMSFDFGTVSLTTRKNVEFNTTVSEALNILKTQEEEIKSKALVDGLYTTNEVRGLMFRLAK